MSNAVEDIVYLGKRLKGIIELSDKLTTQEALENNITELQGSVDKLKVELETMHATGAAHMVNYQSLMDAYDQKIKDTEKNIADMLAAAKEEAAQIVQEANTKADKVIKDTEESLGLLDAKVVAKTQELKSIENEVSKANDKLNTLNRELEALKSRF